MRRATYQTQLHPISIKLMIKGHPWVLKDQYTEQFPLNERFIVALNRRRPFALMLHDPTHDRIKCRTWAMRGDFTQLVKNFRKDLKQRIQNSILKRRKSKVHEKRNNYYLIFGEADQLPGLFVTYLNGEILIQYYAHFWDGQQQTVLKTIQDVYFKFLHKEIESSSIWIQNRSTSAERQTPPVCLNDMISTKRVEIEEYGVKYSIVIGENYDHGIYTDMSSIRNRMRNSFAKAKNVLNLYSYTGAFSLFAIKAGAEHVTSVDLSKKYIEALDHNISLNEYEDKHTSICSDAISTIDKMIDDGKKFDVLVCDPPSQSSNGSKRSNALKDYERIIPAAQELLNVGGKAYLFLNTHKVARYKFKNKLEQIIGFHQLKGELKVSDNIFMSGDCPTMKGFPEGDYIKCFVITKTKDLDEEKRKVAHEKRKAGLSKTVTNKEVEHPGNQQVLTTRKREMNGNMANSRSVVEGNKIAHENIYGIGYGDSYGNSNGNTMGNTNHNPNGNRKNKKRPNNKNKKRKNNNPNKKHAHQKNEHRDNNKKQELKKNPNVEQKTQSVKTDSPKKVEAQTTPQTTTVEKKVTTKKVTKKSPTKTVSPVKEVTKKAVTKKVTKKTVTKKATTKKVAKKTVTKKALTKKVAKKTVTKKAVTKKVAKKKVAKKTTTKKVVAKKKVTKKKASKKS